MQFTATPGGGGQTSPIIENFPNDGRTWRLDWLGDVFYSRAARYKTPYIRVAMSPYEGVFNCVRAEQRQFIVSLGTLPSLVVGTLWKGGQYAGSDSGTMSTFDVVSTSGKVHFAKAGVDDHDGHFLLPFHEHACHAKHTQSWCLILDARGDCSMIVPCMELIRFYFGSSSRLVTRLFQAPFKEQNFWENVSCNQTTGNAHIDLVAYMPGSSAADIARIALDPAAHHAAKMISASFLASTEDKHYAKTHLPFSGVSQIRALGRWVARSPARFLVYELQSCTHPFPFRKLNYTMSRRKSGGPAPAMGPAQNEATLTLKLPHVSKHVSLESDPPTARRQPIVAKVWSKVRFPDLMYKTVSRGDPTTAPIVMKWDIPEPEGAIVEGETGGLRPPVDLTRVSDAQTMTEGYPPANPAFGQQVLRIVADLTTTGYEVSFVSLNPRQRYPQISQMPRLVADDGEIDCLSYVAVQESTRPRLLSVMLAAQDGIVETVIIIESTGLVGYGEAPITLAADVSGRIDAGWVARAVACVEREWTRQ